jgi:hypothetical protein
MALPPFLNSALATLAWRSFARPVVLIGGALLIGGLVAATIGSPPTTPPSATAITGYRLVLETEADPACVYGSAWNDGDVVLTHDASDGKTVTLTSRYDFAGCTWEAHEVLTPSSDGYAYEYNEHIVACGRSFAPSIACPRRGHVSVVPVDQ